MQDYQSKPPRKDDPRAPRRAWQEQPVWTDHVPVLRDEDIPDAAEEIHRPCERLASNLTIRLAATIASMLSLFALFLLFAEKRSRAIRHYSLQSVCLTGMHLALIAAVTGLSGLLGALPVLGYVVRLICLVMYASLLSALVVLRVRLMLFAWRGYRWDVPVLGRWLQRFV